MDADLNSGETAKCSASAIQLKANARDTAQSWPISKHVLKRRNRHNGRLRLLQCCRNQKRSNKDITLKRYNRITSSPPRISLRLQHSPFLHLIRPPGNRRRISYLPLRPINLRNTYRPESRQRTTSHRLRWNHIRPRVLDAAREVGDSLRWPATPSKPEHPGGKEVGWSEILHIFIHVVFGSTPAVYHL